MRMIPLESRLENVETTYAAAARVMNGRGFTLGGNWDYDHGCFDRPLDDRRQVWLRVPFRVTGGSLNGEAAEANEHTRIRFETPFVLKHVYEEGIDEEGQAGPFRSLVDQFQDPSDPDAAVADDWIDLARRQLSELESALIS
jgi:hypothetical protein